MYIKIIGLGSNCMCISQLLLHENLPTWMRSIKTGRYDTLLMMIHWIRSTFKFAEWRVRKQIYVPPIVVQLICLKLTFGYDVQRALNFSSPQIQNRPLVRSYIKLGLSDPLVRLC
jgi:hypothetical protein